MPTSFHLHKKSSEVSIENKVNPSLAFNPSQDTKHTTVKWPIVHIHVRLQEISMLTPPRVIANSKRKESPKIFKGKDEAQFEFLDSVGE